MRLMALKPQIPQRDGPTGVETDFDLFMGWRIRKGLLEGLIPSIDRLLGRGPVSEGRTFREVKNDFLDAIPIGVCRGVKAVEELLPFKIFLFIVSGITDKVPLALKEPKHSSICIAIDAPLPFHDGPSKRRTSLESSHRGRR